MTDEVMFRMQLTRDGVLTITRLPKPDPGRSPEAVTAGVLRTIADWLESGATRLTVTEVPR